MLAGKKEQLVPGGGLNGGIALPLGLCGIEAPWVHLEEDGASLKPVCGQEKGNLGPGYFVGYISPGLVRTGGSRPTPAGKRG